MANYYSVMTPHYIPVGFRFTEDESILLSYMGISIEECEHYDYFFTEEGCCGIELEEIEDESESVVSLYKSLLEDGDDTVYFEYIIQTALSRADNKSDFVQYATADYCDKARMASTGGQAVHVTRDNVRYISTWSFLQGLQLKNDG